MYSHILINALFVAAVTLIWFMLAWQTLLFFCGHHYYRMTRRPGSKTALPDEDLPSVSILVPCHNEEMVIAATIRALLDLEYPAEKLEFLIVNDGSTDRTGEIVLAQGSRDRIRVIDVPLEEAARGKAAALNCGLRRARHPLLAVYDADNVPEAGSLRPLVEELVADPRLTAAIGMYRAGNRHRNLLTRFLNIEGIGFQWIVQAGRWTLLRFTTLPGTNYVIRREVVEKLGGWDERALTEDAELTLRVYLAGGRIKFVPESVSWEQEPETLGVWFRQRNRWVRGYNYLLRKFAGGLWRARHRRAALELLYSLSLYYVFFLAIVVSDILFVLSATRLVRIDVPGPYSVVWLLAFVTFVLQVVIALACEEGEDSPRNILLTMLMYFTYCQLWIPVVAVAFWDDFVARRPMRWAKTERFEPR